MTLKANIWVKVFLAIIIYLPAIAFAAPEQQLTPTNNIFTGYKITDKEASTHFILTFTDNPDYKISTLANPERIVIDIKNTTWGKFDNGDNDTKFISQVRHRETSENDLRIVLDLVAAFKIKSYYFLPQKDNEYRLLIDIVPKVGEVLPATVTLEDGTKIAVPLPKLKDKIKPLIAIDAGHGGNDPGTTGYSGTQEKKVTLAYAYALKKELEKTGRYKVLLTRSDDTYVDLKKRVQIARDAKANMFVSIHADAHKNPKMRGLSIYTISEKASDKEAEALAQKENTAGLLTNVDVKGDSQDVTELLIDLVQRESKNLSADFAEEIIREISPQTQVLYVSPHRFAGFRVLTAPDIPSALIELGYLSSPEEEKMLLSEKHKKILAEAIVRSIDNHFRKYPVD